MASITVLRVSNTHVIAGRASGTNVPRAIMAAKMIAPTNTYILILSHINVKKAFIDNLLDY
jgi:hypothetical protein